MKTTVPKARIADEIADEVVDLIGSTKKLESLMRTVDRVRMNEIANYEEIRRLKEEDERCKKNGSLDQRLCDIENRLDNIEQMISLVSRQPVAKKETAFPVPVNVLPTPTGVDIIERNGEYRFEEAPEKMEKHKLRVFLDDQ